MFEDTAVGILANTETLCGNAGILAGVGYLQAAAHKCAQPLCKAARDNQRHDVTLRHTFVPARSAGLEVAHKPALDVL